MPAIPVLTAAAKERPTLAEKTWPNIAAAPGLGRLPGWIIMVALATDCYALADLLAAHIPTSGPSLVEPVTLAIILGLVLRNAGLVPATCEAGIRNYELPLKVGVVLLGLSLTVADVVRVGIRAIAVVVICLIISPAVIYIMARRFRISPKLGILIGVGTTICGSTAIAIAAPAIEAKDEEVAYAIGTISLIGTLAMLTLPLAGAAAGLTDSQFGMLAGTAVAATPQVIGAASMYSHGAIAQATVVKMTRNIFMIPAGFLLGVWYARQKASAAGRRPHRREYWTAVPAFLCGFLLLAIARSILDHFELLPPDLLERALSLAAWTAKFSILVAMAGIGLNTRLGAMRQVGSAPLLVGFLGALFLALTSYALIRGLASGG